MQVVAGEDAWAERRARDRGGGEGDATTVNTAPRGSSATKGVSFTTD